MKKGKNPTLIVLAVEIASIIILHAVKINQSEKATGKEDCQETIPASKSP